MCRPMAGRFRRQASCGTFEGKISWWIPDRGAITSTCCRSVGRLRHSSRRGDGQDVAGEGGRVGHDLASDDGIAIQDVADLQVGGPASVCARVRAADVEHGVPGGHEVHHEVARGRRTTCTRGTATSAPSCSPYTRSPGRKSAMARLPAGVAMGVSGAAHLLPPRQRTRPVAWSTDAQVVRVVVSSAHSSSPHRISGWPITTSAATHLCPAARAGGHATAGHRAAAAGPASRADGRATAAGKILPRVAGPFHRAVADGQRRSPRTTSRGGESNCRLKRCRASLAHDVLVQVDPIMNPRRGLRRYSSGKSPSCCAEAHGCPDKPLGSTIPSWRSPLFRVTFSWR